MCMTCCRANCDVVYCSKKNLMLVVVEVARVVVVVLVFDVDDD